MKRRMVLWMLGAGLLLNPLALSSQEDIFSEDEIFSEEGLFDSGEDMIEEQPEEESSDPAEAFLEEEEGLAWGGRFTFQGSSRWIWQDFPDGGNLSWSPPAEEELLPEVSGDLYFSARPRSDYRVYGKFRTRYPFSLDMVEIEIFELYSDFNWEDRLFFRAGKQVVNWGVGYFFSPADLLSLAPLDPESPEEDREGPLALKGHMPWGVHNLYLYTLVKDHMAEDGRLTPSELGWAAKAEWVIGGWEWGLGTYWQRDVRPRMMSTLTGSLGVVDLFGEAVVSWGTDRTFLLPSGERETRKDQPFFWGTAGFRVSRGDLGPGGSASVAGQYFFNGDGYGDSSLYEEAWAQAALGRLAPGDLRSFGRHYGALSAAWSQIGGSPLGLSSFWLGNLSDASGTVQLQGSWQILDEMQLSLGPRVVYGAGGTETVFSSQNRRVLLEVTLSAGSGPF